MRAILLSLLLLASSAVADSPVLFKMCFKAPLANGEAGCYDGTKSVTYNDWMKKVDPKAKVIRVEVLPSGIARIFYVY